MAQADVTQPCKRNCCLDQNDICLGCGRLLSEILAWHQADECNRRQILLQAETRLAARVGLTTNQASLGKPV